MKIYSKCNNRKGVEVSMSELKTRIEEANGIFLDMKYFFGSEEKLLYLKTIIPAKDILTILNDLNSCFLEVEDYEKCETIKKWKEKL